jgi:hypothetical protein
MASTWMVSGQVVGISGAAPGPERSRLGFATVAPEEFSFLLGLGFALTELSYTVARYETDRRLVRVFHGRWSYELGVDVGRGIEVDGVRREQAFPLRDVVAPRGHPAEVGYGGTSATTSESVRKFLGLLATWTHEFAGPFLSDGDRWFDRLSESNAVRAQAEQDELHAARLRARAGEAWQRRDFGTVVNAYREIEAELPAVVLRASERGRLDYALRALGEPFHLPTPTAWPVPVCTSGWSRALRSRPPASTPTESPPTSPFCAWASGSRRRARPGPWPPTTVGCARRSCSRWDRCRSSSCSAFAPPVLDDLRERDVPTRVYVPYGSDWFRYWLRRLAESRGA